MKGNMVDIVFVLNLDSENERKKNLWNLKM